MKKLIALFSCIPLIAFGQAGGRQGTEIRTSGSAGGAATNAVATVSKDGTPIVNGATSIDFTNAAGSTVTVTANGSQARIGIPSGGGSVDPTNAVLVNIIATGASTNTYYSTNLAITYNLATAFQNALNNSYVKVQVGTNSVTPSIASSNGTGGITLNGKTNILFEGYGVTLSGRAAPGEVVYATNCHNLTFRGFTFDGLVITNINNAVTNYQFGIFSLAFCNNLLFEDCKFVNGHNFGLLDLATTAGASWPTLTTNVTVRRCYIYNTGSAMTNNPLSYDGAGIEMVDWTVDNCVFEENIRGIEIYDDTAGRFGDRTIIRNNTFKDSLQNAITMSGSTNANKMVIEGNKIFNTQGYTRRGTNYFTDNTAINITGGHSHKIANNTIIGTNYAGITLGGSFRMDDIVLANNIVNGFGIGILTCNNASTYHFNTKISGNTVINAGSPFGFSGLRNSLVDGNTVIRVRTLNLPGFDFFNSGNFASTNVFVIGNVASDTLGNMDFGFSSGNLNSNIVFGPNQSIGHTSGYIEGSVGDNVVLRGYNGVLGLPEFSETLVLKEALFRDPLESFEPFAFGFYGSFWGLTNRNTGNLIMLSPDPTEDNILFKGEVRPSQVGANAMVYTDGNTNLKPVTIGANVSFVGGTLSASGSGGGGNFNVNQFSASTTHTNIKSGVELTNASNQNITNKGTVVHPPNNLTMLGTNVFFDGSSGTLFTGLFNSVSAGLTNVGVTNIADGQTIRAFIFASNGVTVQFPFNAVGDFLDAGIVVPATNAWTELVWTRRGSYTNLEVKTALFSLSPAANILFITNFATRTLIISNAPITATAFGNNGDIQYAQNNALFATNRFNIESNRNKIWIKGVAASGTNGTRGGLIVTNDSSGTYAEFNSSGISALSFITLSLGGTFDGFGTNVMVLTENIFRPTVSNSLDLGIWGQPFRSNIMMYFRMPIGGGANKVLTSDADGVGTWQTPAAGGSTNLEVVSIGTGTLGVGYITNQTYYLREEINGGTAATNISFTGSIRKVMTNDMSANLTFNLSNIVEGAIVTMDLNGATNTATDYTVTFTTTGGAKLNWSSPTNGSTAFTVYSNSIVRINFGRVATNQFNTNIPASYVVVNGFAQRGLVYSASAGSGTSNIFYSGKMYNDFTIYTNHSSAGLNYTNVVTILIPAHTMTNNGEGVVLEATGNFRAANNGTNQFIAGFGSTTNVFDTGQFTNQAGVGYELKVGVYRINGTQQKVKGEFRLAGLTTLASGYTNFFSYITETNGVTNVFRLQGRGFGAGAWSNDITRVYWESATR